MITLYVLKYPNNLYVGIDRSSGGYPYSTIWFKSAELFTSEQEAINYIEKFPNESFSLIEVDIHFKKRKYIK